MSPGDVSAVGFAISRSYVLSWRLSVDENFLIVADKVNLLVNGGGDRAICGRSLKDEYMDSVNDGEVR